METVIAIPLFMLLIGGTIWIGQLSYDKQKLVITDRYVAWNVGDRHPLGAETMNVQDRFFGGSQTEKVTVETTPGSANRWGQESWGGVDLEVKTPPWTFGFLLAGQGSSGGGSAAETQVPLLRGRDIPDWRNPDTGELRYRGHVVLMRSGQNGVRESGVSANQPLPGGYADVGDALKEPWPEEAGKQRTAP